jgi:hypothetical protein
MPGPSGRVLKPPARPRVTSIHPWGGMRHFAERCARASGWDKLFYTFEDLEVRASERIKFCDQFGDSYKQALIEMNVGARNIRPTANTLSSAQRNAHNISHRILLEMETTSMHFLLLQYQQSIKTLEAKLQNLTESVAQNFVNDVQHAPAVIQGPVDGCDAASDLLNLYLCDAFEGLMADGTTPPPPNQHHRESPWSSYLETLPPQQQLPPHQIDGSSSIARSTHVDNPLPPKQP